MGEICKNAGKNQRIGEKYARIRRNIREYGFRFSRIFYAVFVKQRASIRKKFQEGQFYV